MFINDSHNIRFNGPSEEMQKGLEIVKSVFQQEELSVQEIAGLNENGQYVHRIRIFSKGEPLSLNDLQKKTEKKILYLKKECLQKDDQYLKSELDKAIEARKFYKFLQEESTSFLWGSTQKKAKSFYVKGDEWDTEKTDQLQKAFPTEQIEQVFPDEEVTVKEVEEVQKGYYVSKITLSRSGKELGFSDLISLTAKKIDNLRQWITEAQEKGLDATNLQTELGKAKQLSSELDTLENHVISYKPPSRDVRMTISSEDWNSLKEHVEEVFDHPRFKISRVKKDDKTFIEFKLDDKSLSLPEFNFIIDKRKKQLDSLLILETNSEKIKQYESQRKTINELFEISKKIVPYKTLKHTISQVFNAAIKPLTYLFTSEKRLVLKDIDTEGVPSFDDLMERTFGDELDVVSKTQGTKAEVLQKGRPLTQAELLNKTIKKIERLQINLFSHEESSGRDKISEKLIAANQLVKQLSEAKDSRSIKQYGWIGVAFVINLLKNALIIVGKGISLASKAIYNYVELKYEQYGETEKDMIKAAFQLRSLLDSNKAQSFESEYKKIRKGFLTKIRTGFSEEIEYYTRKLAALDNALVKMGDGLIRKAVKNNKLLDAQYIIKNKLFKTISHDTLDTLAKTSFNSEAEKETLISQLYYSCENEASMNRIFKYLLNNGNKQLAEKILFNQFKPQDRFKLPGVNSNRVQEVYQDLIESPEKAKASFKAFLKESDDASDMVRKLRTVLTHTQNTVEVELFVNALYSAKNKDELLTVIDSNLFPEKSIESEHKFERSKQDFSRLLAARIGSNNLLSAAFNLGNIDELDEVEVINKVRPFIFTQNRKSQSLLQYACQGQNAKFVTAVDKAIREDYKLNTKNNQKLKDFLNFLNDYPTRLQVKQKIEELNLKSFVTGITDFENKYLGDPVNKRLSLIIDHRLTNLIHREFKNRTERGPFHAKDSSGSRPLMVMSMALALDLDKYNNTPRCFTNAVAYYTAIKDERVGWVQGVALGGKLSNYIGLNVIDLVSTTTFFQKNFIFQGVLLILGTLGWITKESKIGKFITRNWMGYSRGLAEYEEKNKIDNRKIQPNTTESRFRKGYYAAKSAFLSIGGGKNVQSILQALRDQDAVTTLRLLRKLEIKLTGNDAVNFLEDYNKLITYPSRPANIREQLLEVIFEKISYSEHIFNLFKININQGENGKELVRNLISKKIEEWSVIEKFTLEKYKACLLAAVALGDNDLYTKLLDIKPGRVAFDLNDGWYTSGGTSTSLLHLATSSNEGAAQANYADASVNVLRGMVASNRFNAQADVFNEEVARTSNPTDIKRDGNRPADLISLERANLIDTRLGVESDEKGFSDIVRVRDNAHWDYVNKIIENDQINLFVNVGVGALIDNIPILCAAIGFAQGGPPLAYAATVVSYFSINGLCFSGALLTKLATGNKFSDAWDQAEVLTKGYDSKINLFGNTREEAEEFLKGVDLYEVRKKAMKFVVSEVINEIQNFKNGCDDPVLMTDLDELILDLESFNEQPFNRYSAKKISDIIRRADLPPNESDALQTSILQKLSSKEWYEQLAKAI